MKNKESDLQKGILTKVREEAESGKITFKSDKKIDFPVTKISPKIREAINAFDRTIYGTSWDVLWREAKTGQPIHETEDVEYEDVTHKRLEK